ncbi:MAG: hypothetical protein JWO96_215 [Candidatus Saccharibacteria bacterium]|nr:hypothetical protein [Candidatus Saccharibacteria bacterium]
MTKEHEPYRFSTSATNMCAYGLANGNYPTDWFKIAINHVRSDQHIADSASKTLQEAVVRRYGALSRLHLGIKAGDKTIKKQAKRELDESAAMTEDLINAMSEDAAGMSIDHSPRRRRLMAEYGATITMAGRIAVVADTLGTYLGPGRPMELFSQAEMYLVQGDNQLYATENAMHAARFEAWEGNKDQAVLWLGKAARSVLQTHESDPKNFLPSVDTIIEFGADLSRSPTAIALTAVTARP